MLMDVLRTCIADGIEVAFAMEENAIRIVCYKDVDVAERFVSLTDQQEVIKALEEMRRGLLSASKLRKEVN